jgi:hypothetical protein
MKCGTTSLYQYLKNHPQVCTSSPKETDFFLERNGKVGKWYRSCFKEEARASGEFCTDYTKHPLYSGVPERMHELLPQVKLIYLVRDPLKRAVSHYTHNWVLRRTNNSIDEVFQPFGESKYLNTSRYYYQLSQYLEYYSKNDILVIQSERLRKNREDVLRRIFRFIGVDPTYEDETFEQEHHVSPDQKRMGTTTAFFRKSTLGRKIINAGKQFISRKVLEQIKRVLSTDAQRPTLSREVRSQAQEYLREDVECLRALTGKKFREWSV